VQAHAAHARQSDNFDVDPAFLGLAAGGGRPLPQALLAKMESAFRADFSRVRVHVGPQAPRIGATAFTLGDDLYFAPGQFQPDTLQGQRLIGHELAHVIQQRQGRVRAPGPGVTVVQDTRLEAEADRLGMLAAGHRPVVAQSKRVDRPVPGGRVVQRNVQGSVAAGFHRHGRVAGHDSAANRHALSEKIIVRGIAGGGGNNRYETELYNTHYVAVGGGYGPGAVNFDLIAGNLSTLNRSWAICHKRSDKEIQRLVVAAANQYRVDINIGPALAARNALRARLQELVNSIAPALLPGAAAGGPFAAAATAAHNTAGYIAANIGSAAMPVTAVTLTTFAGCIANSPMNLFIGVQRVNASISDRTDFNSTPNPAAAVPAFVPPALVRTMTPHSLQVVHAPMPQLAALTLLTRPVGPGEAHSPGSRRHLWAGLAAHVALPPPAGAIPPLPTGAALEAAHPGHFMMSSSSDLAAPWGAGAAGPAPGYVYI
jgi:hypothetical protein